MRPRISANPLAVPRFLFGLRKVAPKKTLFFALSQSADAILSTTIAPLFVSALLVSITEGTATLAGSSKLLLFYGLSLFFGEVVFIRLSIYLAYLSESAMQVHVSKRILTHLLKRSLSYHANHMTGGTISNATKLVSAIERFWDTLMFTVVPIVTTIIAVCIALSFIFWPYAITLFILSVITTIVIVFAQSKIAITSRLAAEKMSATTAYMSDVITNISAVKSFAREKDELNTFSSKLEDWLKVNRVEMKRVLVITGSFGIIMTLMNIVAFAAAIYATQLGFANVGAIYLVIVYTLSVVSQLWSVTSATRNYTRIIGDAGPMIETLAEPIEINDIAKPLKTNLKHGVVSFNSINFTHSDSDETLFRNFSLEIPAGQHVGLVGHSGSGKTSLSRLLLRFNDIDAGSITIDGANIAKLSQDDLHRAISYVPQEPLLFHRTLSENIAYGVEHATIDDIKRVAHDAHVEEFVHGLPNGYDTIVGERGIKLSGGQRQRIAIARAMLKKSPILLLDEATSALDSESERLIQQSLGKLMQGRTAIIIAHRLSTVSRLDRIVVLDNGRIIEDGTHSALIKSSGTYAKLWKYQSTSFVDE